MRYALSSDAAFAVLGEPPPYKGEDFVRTTSPSALDRSSLTESAPTEYFGDAQDSGRANFLDSKQVAFTIRALALPALNI